MVLVGIYQVNKDYIIENYCINKEKPEMKCNGKCHMKKMLSKTKESEQESFPAGTINFKSVSYILPQINKEVLFKNKPSISSNTKYRELLRNTHYFIDIFHPPKV